MYLIYYVKYTFIKYLIDFIKYLKLYMDVKLLFTYSLINFIRLNMS